MMRQSKFKLILVAVVLLVLAHSPAWAEIHAADSLEWMTVDSSLIVRGKIIKHEHSCDFRDKGKQQPYHREYDDFTIEVQETLRGNPVGKMVKLRMYDGELTKTDGDYVFFLDKGKPYLICKTKSGDAYNNNDFVGWWVPRSYKRQSVIDLKNISHVYKMDKTFARDVQTILQTIRKYSGRHIVRNIAYPESDNMFRKSNNFVDLELFSSPCEIYKDLYSGSACYLRVPVP